MRPNQQNNKNRSRGRNNNNGGRKHVNPLSRNFESNGPDVKVRGNAAHIAEKYVQLARDAQASGDSVMAENYLQHAEHYYRIVSAAQPQGMRSDQFGQDFEAEEDEGEEVSYANSRFEPRFPSREQPQQQSQSEAEQQEAAPVAAPVPAQPERAESAPAEGGGENLPRRARERRQRRRPRNHGEGGEGDAGGAPQPEIGELPAFLTAGGAAAAE